MIEIMPRQEPTRPCSAASCTRGSMTRTRGLVPLAPALVPPDRAPAKRAQGGRSWAGRNLINVL